MATIRISEFRFYSPLHDDDMVRLSCFDARGDEFFMLMPEHVPGHSYRDRRQDAAEAIHQAMRAGLSPGEVRVLP